MEARIPFAGFYETHYDHEIDSTLESLSESEMSSVGGVDMLDLLQQNLDYGVVHRMVAEAYAEAFAEYIADEHGIHLGVTFRALQSPREYNFETDMILVDIPCADVRLLVESVGAERLQATAKSMFTSRDGFISFYAPDIGTWGDVPTWDHNQVYCALTALVTMDTEWEYTVLESVLDSEIFYQAVEGMKVRIIE